MDTSLRWYGDTNKGQKEARQIGGLLTFNYELSMQGNILICFSVIYGYDYKLTNLGGQENLQTHLFNLVLDFFNAVDMGILIF